MEHLFNGEFMVRVKIDKDRFGTPRFKISFTNLNEKESRIIKRALIDGKEVKGNFKYEVPLKYFIPIINNIDKENLIIDRYSELSFLEFSDIYDEKYFYTFEANAKYMRKWREEECPNIYKIEIDRNTLDISKEVIFKKINRIY